MSEEDDVARKMAEVFAGIEVDRAFDPDSGDLFDLVLAFGQKWGVTPVGIKLRQALAEADPIVAECISDLLGTCGAIAKGMR